MKKFIKKNSRVLAAGLIGVSLFSVSNFVKASDDNIGYSFTIQPNYGNSYSSARYRQTTSTENPWKVDFRSSTEGAGTIISYWLQSDEGNGIVSPIINVTQGTKKYSGAYPLANQSYVKLGAENNNYSTYSYSVSGYWDEETW